MNSEILQTYLPTIKQVGIANTALLLYFSTPNFISFALLLLLVSALFFPQVLEKFNSIQTSENASCCSVNGMLQSYLQYGFVKKSILIVFVAVLSQLTYILPTWLIVFVAAQIYGFWDILVEFGVIQIACSAFSNMENSLNKLISLIPRYEEKI